MLEGWGLHPKVGSGARHPGEEESRHWKSWKRKAGMAGPPSPKSNTETHTWRSLGERQEAVMEYLLDKGKKKNQPCKTQLSDQDAVER